MTKRPRLFGTLGFLAAWMSPWRTVFRARATVTGATFFVHRHDAVGRHIAKYGTYEPLLTRWIAHRLTESPGMFIDVGANIGWHAVHAGLAAKAASIVAFEADLLNAWLLQRNLSENGIGNAIVVAAAVGARRGTARLNRATASNLTRPAAVDHARSSVTVPLLDLDGALHDLGLSAKRVSVLKIDVEGYEPAVIAGAARTLARTNAIVLALSPALSGKGGLSVTDMVAALRGNDFTAFTIGDDLTLRPADLERLLTQDGQTDIVWLSKAAASEPY